MSDIESDLENVAFKRKKNGYTYYGKADRISSFKLVLTVFLIAVTFLLIGVIAGYYLGYDAVQLYLSRTPPYVAPPLPYVEAPLPYVEAPYVAPNVEVDPFKMFMRGGIRYGGDYGYDTTNHPAAAHRRRVAAEGEEEKLKKQCANRRCCHPSNGDTAKEGHVCYALTIVECCEKEAEDICDWNCEFDVGNRRKDHIVRGDRKRNKICAGHNDADGKGIDNEIKDDDPPGPDSGKPKNRGDLEERDGLNIVDECGDIWADLLDDETADKELKEDGKKKHEELGAKDHDHRRLAVFGHDSQEEQRSRSWPQEFLGLITFETADGTMWCSGTKVNYKNILTAGHCCHSGKDQWGNGGNWYRNWKWYPGVTDKSQVVDGNARSVWYATAFNGWIYHHKNWDYDMCWLTLHSSYYGWFGFGYDNNIPATIPSFDFWGYPVYKPNSGTNQIKWGDSDCRPTQYETNQFKYQCDTGGGQSGSGLYRDSTRIVYCILSYEWPSQGYNGCSRITADKFNSMYDNMKSQNGWG